jgi:hypothetical protein
MRSLNRFTALGVGVLLLAAPAASACGDLGVMIPGCPMAEMAEMPEMSQMAEMAGSTGRSPCHSAGEVGDDCCKVRSAPEPTQALSFASAKLLTVLEVTDLQVVAPLAPAAQPPHFTPADASRLHDLGRYTLFSAFLL